MKKIKWIRIIVKAAIFVVAIVLCSVYIQAIAPTIANDLATYQMTNNPDSSTTLYLYSKSLDYIWIVPVLLWLILFLPEVVKAIKYIIKKDKGEVKNEKEI